MPRETTLACPRPLSAAAEGAVDLVRQWFRQVGEHGALARLDKGFNGRAVRRKPPSRAISASESEMRTV
jgi:hypothetical protein